VVVVDIETVGLPMRLVAQPHQAAVALVALVVEVQQ
jgi:hypothetical protein